MSRRPRPKRTVLNISGWWVEPAGDNLCVIACDGLGMVVGRYNPRQASIVPYDRWLAAIDRLHERRIRARITR